MALLGAPEEYSAAIVDSRTQEPLLRLPWSKIDWQRARNKVTLASVLIAEADGGIEACGVIGGLRTWSQMLRIERNGQPVWDGPITSWGRPSLAAPGAPRGVTINAHDRFILASKRLVGINLTIGKVVDAGDVFRQLLLSGAIGGGNDPFTLTIPALTSFLRTANFIPDGSGGWTTYTHPYGAILTTANWVDRDYRISRLEPIASCIDELAGLGLVSYAQVLDAMYVHEVQARDLIGGPLERAMLNEWTTIGIPGVNVDGLSQASTTYVGSQSMGRVGFATYTTKSPYSTQYSGGVLEKGTTIQRSNDVDPRYGSGGYNSPLDIAAQAEAVRLTTPNLTIEQVRLSPDFGSPKMAGDLSNLVPGVVLGIDYADTCAFNVPTTTVDLEFRFAWRYDGQLFPRHVPGQDMYSYVFTPRSTSAVTRARLEQLDVSVVAGEQGITEDVKASLVPFVEWDGTLPSGWQEIKSPPPAGLWND